MNTKNFVDGISTIIDSNLESYLNENNYSDILNEIQNGLKIVRKERLFEPNQNVIFELINNYQLSKFEIGMVSFYSEVLFKPNRVLFGEFDEDVLCINRLSDEIELVSAKLDIIKVARNSEMFLSAILESAKYSIQVLMLLDDYDKSRELMLNKSKDIAVTAGGTEYLEFYLRFFGYE